MYKVIIVEDENIIRKGLMYSIPWNSLECSVVGEACNGVEGVMLIKEKNPDIVIMDINMPIKNGLEMLEETYEHSNYSVIILSGYSDFEYAQKAIHYGVKGYLLKPLQVDELIDAIQLAKKEYMVRRSWLNKEREKDELTRVSLLKEFANKTQGNQLVNQMITYIQENYMRKLVIQDFVDKFNYSETFLNKIFKEGVGTTCIEYLNRCRIQKSLELIVREDLSMKEIAYQCGVGDYKYFNVVFRKYIGCSPKEFKNELRK